MSKTGKSIISFTVILLPCFVYLIYSFLNSGTLFRADDFHLLKTVVWMQDANGPVEKFKLLIQQHNEHRIIIPRLLTYLDYVIEGAINWRTLILIGNLLWVSTLWFLWKAFQSRNLPVWMFIPLPYILLQPQYYDNVNWAISILQQSVIVFWFGLLCFLLSRNKTSWTILVAIMATFTHGNGIFSFLIGIIFCVIHRDWKSGLRWFAALLIIGVIYFWGFEKGQNADIQNSLSNPGRLVMAFLAFFGSVTTIQFTTPIYAVICGGVLVLVLAVYIIPKIVSHFNGGAKLVFFDKILLGNLLFLGITAALVSVSRSWSGVESILTPRYQHYSPYVICWAYLTILVSATGSARKFIAILALGAALLFNALSYFVYNQEVIFRKNWLVADTNNWRDHAVLLNDAKSFNDNIREPYNESLARGICRMEPYLLAPDTMKATVDTTIDLSSSKTDVIEKGVKGPIVIELLEISNRELTGPTFLYLKTPGQKGYWLPTKISRSSFWELLGHGQTTKPGFSVNFFTENLSPGDYSVYVFNKNRFTRTGKTVRIGG
jgi:hypothetical protein